MSFIYRDATREDIPSIMSMEALSLKHPWSQEDIASLMEPPSGVAGKIALACESEGVLAAYMGASYILDECEIGNVCTHPDYRRQGAACGLFERLFLKCHDLNITSIFLEVSSVNYGAIALYEKLGFTKYNSRQDYYGKGDDALLFVYKL